MKAVLYRLGCGMNKFYGEAKSPSLWEGKKVYIIATCGYPPDKSADLFETGIKRYRTHSRLIYGGMLCESHMGYNTAFMDTEKQARKFAKTL